MFSRHYNYAVRNQTTKTLPVCLQRLLCSERKILIASASFDSQRVHFNYVKFTRFHSDMYKWNKFQFHKQTCWFCVEVFLQVKLFLSCLIKKNNNGGNRAPPNEWKEFHQLHKLTYFRRWFSAHTEKFVFFLFMHVFRSKLANYHLFSVAGKESKDYCTKKNKSACKCKDLND